MKNPLKVLSTEIEKKSLPHLLPLAHVFGLDADQFYKQIIDHLLKKLTECKICEGLQSAVTFSEFKPFLSKIRNLPLAIDTSCIIALEFPCGEDRVLAYKMAQSLAEKWVQLSSKTGV